jgi:hypothetical protein
LPGVPELGGLAEVHRAAGVDQHVDVQVLLFQEHLEEQPVEPGVGVPVDEPQVVAGDVVAEVGELDALPFPPAPPLPFHPPTKDLAADQLHRLQLRQQLGR